VKVTQRTVVAVVLAGIAGTLINTLAIAAVLGADKLALALAPGRYGVAIAVAALIPAALALIERRAALVVAGLLLTVIPSLLAKLVFGSGAPWGLVFALNAVYAVAAIVVYLAAAGGGKAARR